MSSLTNMAVLRTPDDTFLNQINQNIASFNDEQCYFLILGIFASMPVSMIKEISRVDLYKKDDNFFYIKLLFPEKENIGNNVIYFTPSFDNFLQFTRIAIRIISTIQKKTIAVASDKNFDESQNAKMAELFV